MDRRSFLAAATSASLLPGAARSRTERCRADRITGVGKVKRCDVGVPIWTTPEQSCQFWSWAACCEAMFSLGGLRVDQTVFIGKAYGDDPACQAATGPMIKAAIDGPWYDSVASLRVIVDSQDGISHPDPISVIWNELNENRALIAGALDHAVLITEMHYTVGPQGTQTDTIVVRDPVMTAPNRRTFSKEEFSGTTFLAALRLT